MAFRSVYPDVAIPEVALTDYVLAQAHERGDKPALIDGPSGRSITYAQLPGMVARAAAGLARRAKRSHETQWRTREGSDCRSRSDRLF